MRQQIDTTPHCFPASTHTSKREAHPLSNYGMAGRTPYECCVALGYKGSSYVGLMPVVLLDEIALDWSRRGLPAVNDVLAHYTRAGLTRCVPTDEQHGTHRVCRGTPACVPLHYQLGMLGSLLEVANQVVGVFQPDVEAEEPGSLAIRVRFTLAPANH